MILNLKEKNLHFVYLYTYHDMFHSIFYWQPYMSVASNDWVSNLSSEGDNNSANYKEMIMQVMSNSL